MPVIRQTGALSRGRGRRRGQGFTLIELMVTVAVLGILAAVAAPSMVALIEASRLNGAASEVTSALQVARSEAVRRNATVTACGSADGTACANGTSWQRLIVRHDNGTAGDPAVIQRFDAPGSLQVSGPSGGIEFKPSGRIDAESTVTACIPDSSSDENQRVITVMISGVVTSSRNNGSGACP